MIPVASCPHCGTRVIAVGNRCPSCGGDVTAETVAAPAAAPARRARAPRRRHPIITAIGAILIVAGLARWYLAGIAGMTDVFWNLALIWAGTLLLLVLSLSAWIQERQRR